MQNGHFQSCDETGVFARSSSARLLGLTVFAGAVGSVAAGSGALCSLPLARSVCLGFCCCCGGGGCFVFGGSTSFGDFDGGGGGAWSFVSNFVSDFRFGGLERCCCTSGFTIAVSDRLVIRVGSFLGGSSSFGLLLVAVSFASGFFLSVFALAGLSSATADLRVTRTVVSLGFSAAGALADSAVGGASGSALKVMIFGIGNPTVFWNLSGTFRTRDDRGEGGTFVSEGVVGADEVSVLLVSFCTGVDTGFAGWAVLIGEGSDTVTDGSFDKTTAKRVLSLRTLTSELSFSFDCVRVFTIFLVGIGDEVEGMQGLEVTLGEITGTVLVSRRVSDTVLSCGSCGFGGASVGALVLGTGDGVECFAKHAA